MRQHGSNVDSAAKKNGKDNVYTYITRVLKLSPMIIRGLSDTYNESDLRQFIDDGGLDLKVNKIVRMVGNRWLVQLTNDSDTKAFSRLQYLLNTKVNIGQCKREGLIQCRNCQRVDILNMGNLIVLKNALFLPENRMWKRVSLLTQLQVKQSKLRVYQLCA